MLNKLRYLLPAVAMVAVLAAVNVRCTPGGVRFDVKAPAPELLSQFGFFEGKMADLQPAPGVLPYDLNSPLFTDYAHKARFVWMPPGTTAQYHAEDAFSFPEGAILIKNFYYPVDFRQPDGPRRIVETRLLIRRTAAWEALTYIWNDDQTDAKLDLAGATLPVQWTHTDGKAMSIKYVVPNRNQCAGCHENSKVLGPIGPKARNLNKDYKYATGAANQLTQWAAAGYLTGAPADPKAAPKLAAYETANLKDPQSVETAARAWLEINCAHCHNPNGPANTSGLDLRASQTDPVKYGICKTPVAAGRGAGSLDHDIVPGHPELSILMYRSESLDPGIMMPEVGRTLNHTEGLALLRQWIQSLPGQPCQTAQ